MAQNPFDIPLRQLQQTIVSLKPVLLQKMGAETILFMEDNFRKQGFQGAVFEPWAPRKHQDKKSVGRHILVKSARLKNSPYYSTAGWSVIIHIPVPYAQIHNEGGTIHHGPREGIMNFARNSKGGLKLGKIQTLAQRKRIVAQNKHQVPTHDVKMPKRQFIGKSPVLDARIENMIVRELNNAISKK